jgi:hypothetical protein
METHKILRRRGSEDNRLTDGGEVVSLKGQPPFTLHEDHWYSFLLESELNLGP